MLRRAGIALSALSALLCLGMLDLWVRSYHGSEMFVYIHPLEPASERLATDFQAFSCEGSVDIHVYYMTSLSDSDHVRDVYRDGGFTYERDFPDFAFSPDWGLSPEYVYGFMYLRADAPYGLPRVQWHFAFPHWAGVVVFGLLPMICLARVVRNLRRRRVWKKAGHLCMSCGYDLRASPGRCPECGTMPAAA